MPDRKKVIKGLECHKRAMYGEIDEHGFACNSCPYKDMKSTCRLRTEGHLMTDALALLKEQEARVMTVDEVRTWISVPRIDREPIWVEIENSVNAWIVSDEYWDMPIDVSLSSDLYGKTWRCWTSRPTEAEREATAWEP